LADVSLLEELEAWICIPLHNPLIRTKTKFRRSKTPSMVVLGVSEWKASCQSQGLQSYCPGTKCADAEAWGHERGGKTDPKAFDRF
jgi:hypothetical protein